MKKRKGDHFMDYADVVETACQTGPAKMVPYSNFARYKELREKFWNDESSYILMFQNIGNWSIFFYVLHNLDFVVFTLFLQQQISNK